MSLFLSVCRCLAGRIERGAVMALRRLFGTALIAAVISVVAVSTASSRVWKATPDAIARDYATINDTRAGGEVVLLMWFVPTMVRPDMGGAPNLIAMLQKYVVIMAVHGHLDKASGSLSFDDIDTLEARDQAGKPLDLLARNVMPPAPTAVLAAIETMFRQSLGAMGKGMKMFVFDAGDVDSCKKGGLSVPLAGETYTWNTPFPGCPR
jgi:hypothetical protein